MSSYHHGNLREVLVDAAVALGREKGPDGVVLREVARRSGVSHNAAYRHFADREELLAEVARVGHRELAEAMRARARRLRVKDPRERARKRLRATGQAYVEYALAEPGLFAVAFDNVHDLGDLAGAYQELVAALDECEATGYMPHDKRPGAELTCWASVHGFAMLYGRGPLSGTTKRERDADLARLLDRIDDSLTP
ncbi:TetR/AcrR family transcriptional regulator [Nocardioides panacisoli]|uniref:TetR/AcrR family transcriptional regulator n=1 Tax=Nocardioides panacisoli TaxID=627624 RepID=A0ABP7IL36_9ACTN